VSSPSFPFFGLGLSLGFFSQGHLLALLVQFTRLLRRWRRNPLFSVVSSAFVATVSFLNIAVFWGSPGFFSTPLSGY